MHRSQRKLVRLAIALGLAAFVSFGTHNAAASPLICDWEGDLYCHDGCIDAYGPNYTGACDLSWGAPTCTCWRWNWS
jgi:hypothetical protein